MTRPSTVTRSPHSRPSTRHMKSATRLWRVAFAAVLCLAWIVGSDRLSVPGTTAAHAATAYNWLQFDGNEEHSGNNTLESVLSPSTVGGLKLLFRATLPDVADGAPAYVSNVNTKSGPQDLLFVTTRAGDIVALNAESGVIVWEQHNPAGSCRINKGSQPCYTTSSPAVDPSLSYVYSYGLDGYVHKYQIGDGTEVTGGGWPELATLKAFDEKGSSALSVVTDSHNTSYLYVTNGGYPGDNGDYQGHVTAINLSTGTQHVFNALCSNQPDTHFVEQPGQPDCPQVQSAIWARPGTIYDPETGKLYMGTGNGPYAPKSFDWGDSIFALNPDGTGNGALPLDSYTPSNYQQMQSQDLDLGSTAPAILPAPRSSKFQHIAVQGGKDARLRLLNLDNLSGKGGPGHIGGQIKTIAVPQGGEILTQPAVWVAGDGSTWTFVANGSGTSALQLRVNRSGTPFLHPAWKSAVPGSSPLVANGVLYVATGGDMRALDPTTGQQLWQDAGIGGIHWESPVVDNGMLYITDENSQLSAYGL